MYKHNNKRTNKQPWTKQTISCFYFMWSDVFAFTSPYSDQAWWNNKRLRDLWNTLVSWRRGCLRSCFQRVFLYLVQYELLLFLFLLFLLSVKMLAWCPTARPRLSLAVSPFGVRSVSLWSTTVWFNFALLFLKSVFSFLFATLFFFNLPGLGNYVKLCSFSSMPLFQSRSFLCHSAFPSPLSWSPLPSSPLTPSPSLWRLLLLAEPSTAVEIAECGKLLGM